MFCSPTGRPLAASNLLHAYQDALEAAGIPKRRVHDARHDYASLLLGEKEDVVTVSRLLGHASVNVTLAVYAHAIPGADRKAVSRLEGILG